MEQRPESQPGAERGPEMRTHQEMRTHGLMPSFPTEQHPQMTPTYLGRVKDGEVRPWH